MDSSILFKGILLGFAIAAPVGPIGVLCIRRTLAFGRLHGLLSGIGAASADAIYGAIAAFGLTVISHFLLDQQIWLHALGGSFLCFLGVQTWRAKVADKPANLAGSRQLFSAYTTTLVLTLTNPMTILSFISIFAGIGITSSEVRSSLFLVFGVFCGSAAWWLLLSVCVGHFREKMNKKMLVWVNRLSAGIIFSFGMVSLWQVIGNLL
ncbi:LysE family transporter [Sporolactobacillus shoreicorticis]|uniref:LysE family translocator n=1 Tax=Sporolactobacillus shoreicorticis TaxID=1923877 RepID=A0ABW5S151_9BACL|nr:LysE family transporter [Sporolactobacillus shoreicorticis]MCO7124589.1 LysE family transporter [Sporolactobacillus shoreicorticis]